MVGIGDVKAGLCKNDRTRTADLGLLALRLGAGGLLAGHGAQKLFGALGGHGLAGTAGWLESLGLRPGEAWATMAGLSEFGGGALMALGLGGPLGPIALQGAMATAVRKADWGKPIWVTAGGGELPTLYAVTGLALGLTGPGRYSLDRALDLRVPKAVTALAVASVAAGIVLTERQSAAAQAEQPAAEEAVMEGPEGGEDRVIETESTGEDAIVGEATRADGQAFEFSDNLPADEVAGGIA